MPRVKHKPVPACVCMCTFALPAWGPGRADPDRVRSSSVRAGHAGLPLRAVCRRGLGEEPGTGPRSLPRSGANGGSPDPGLPGGCLFASPACEGSPGGVPSPAAPGAGFPAGRGGRRQPQSPLRRWRLSPGGEKRSGAVAEITPPKRFAPVPFQGRNKPVPEMLFFV